MGWGVHYALYWAWSRMQTEVWGSAMVSRSGESVTWSLTLGSGPPVLAVAIRPSACLHSP